MELDKLWEVLEKEKGPIKLEEAFSKAGISWEQEGEALLGAWFKKEIPRWKRKFVFSFNKQKVMDEFARSDTFYNLYLLKRTEHEAMTMFFNGFPLRWTELMGIRRRTNNDKM